MSGPCDPDRAVPTPFTFAGCSIRNSPLDVRSSAGASLICTAFVVGLIATLANAPRSSVRYSPSGAM